MPGSALEFRTQALKFATSRPFVNAFLGRVGAVYCITMEIVKAPKAYNPISFPVARTNIPLQFKPV